MQVTAEMKEKVNAKLRECIAIANKRYNIDLKFPTVVYMKRGTTAGTANYRTWTIDINPVLLVENFDDMLNDTVPHELAHLITDTVYPEAHESGPMVRTRRGWKRGKRSVHGAEWQSVMRVLGVNPSRTHNYDTTNARTREKTSYDYKCNCCGAILKMGPKRHATEQRMPGHYTHGACGRARGKLTLVAKTPSATVHAKPVLPMMNLHQHVPPAPKSTAPETGSKLARCYEIYKTYPTMARKDLIQQFVTRVGCTAAGASTYVANCKKMYESGVK